MSETTPSQTFSFSSFSMLRPFVGSLGFSFDFNIDIRPSEMRFWINIKLLTAVLYYSSPMVRWSSLSRLAFAAFSNPTEIKNERRVGPNLVSHDGHRPTAVGRSVGSVKLILSQTDRECDAFWAVCRPKWVNIILLFFINSVRPTKPEQKQ